ncbi:hypothetical protein D6C77_07538 [Aureobasidium pullulans]|nr:hypothetical protein D6C77_07538 [Aureobasidium pullulans]
MRTFHAFAVSLSVLVSKTVAADIQYGVLGFGIQMYQPLCCYSCHDSLSALYLNCTTFSEDMDRHHGAGQTQWQRQAMPAMPAIELGLRPSHIVSHGVTESKQDQCFAKLAANGEAVSNLQSSLPFTAPTVELGTDSTWLNFTGLVNEETYLANYATMKEFVSTEYRHTRYSLITMLFVIGICLIAGTWKSHFAHKIALNSLSLKLNQHLLVPATFNGRHLSPLPYRLGYLPKRALSLFITAYVSLNIIFSAVSFHHVSPNAWYADRRHEIAAYVSNRTGVLSFANLALAILFSGRNNLLMAITGWNQSTMLAIHRWASRVATVQAVVHSIIYTVTYFWTGGSTAYAAEAAKPYYWWGIIATVVLCLAVAFAVLPLRMRSYEVFLIIHIAFAILALMGCWYHIHLRFGSKWGYKVWLYVAFAFWGFDRLMRFFRLMFYNYFGSPIAVVKRVPHTDILEMIIFPKKAWNVRPGQHSFVYIPMLGKPWENHPFTIATWGTPESSRNTQTTSPASDHKEAQVHDTEIDSSSASQISHEARHPDQMVCLMRARKGMTAALLEKLKKSGASSLPISIMTEGLYGGHRTALAPLKTADTIMCIAGGIGITSSMSFLQQYVNETRSLPASGTLMGCATNFVLAWSAREEALLHHVSSSLLPDATTALAQNRHLEYRFWCTGENGSQDKGLEQGSNLQRGRMNIEHVVRSVAEKGRRVVVIVCAPGGMSDEVREAVVGCLRDGMPVDIIEEAFAW